MALELPIILFIISITVSVCYPILRHLPTHVSRWLEERRTKGWGCGRRRKRATTAPQTIRVKPATHLGKRAHDLTAADMARSDYFGGAGGGGGAAARKRQRGRRQGRGGGKGEQKRRNKVSAASGEEQAEEVVAAAAAEGATLSQQQQQQQQQQKKKNAPVIGTPFSGGAFAGRAGCSEPLRDDRTGTIIKSLVAPLHSRHGIQRDAFGNKRPETMRMPIHDDAYFAGACKL